MIFAAICTCIIIGVTWDGIGQKICFENKQAAFPKDVFYQKNSDCYKVYEKLCTNLINQFKQCGCQPNIECICLFHSKYFSKPRNK